MAVERKERTKLKMLEHYAAVLCSVEGYALVRMNNFIIKSSFYYKREGNIKHDVNVVKGKIVDNLHVSISTLIN